MDYEHQGWITNGAAADILEFLIPEASPESANELLNVSDDLDDDGGMVRWEFVALCSMLLDIDDLPIERLKVCSIACGGTLITSHHPRHHRLSHLHSLFHSPANSSPPRTTSSRKRRRSDITRCDG